jgi:antitoxin ParD1/3/4
MPVRNVTLTEELDQFVTTNVGSGLFQDASDIVRAGLRSLERDKQTHEAKLSLLRKAIDQGDASGLVEGDVFGQIRQELNFSATPRS